MLKHTYHYLILSVLFFFAISLSFDIKAQVVRDTIYVSNIGQVYLVFDDAVSIVDLEDQEHYANMVDGNTVIVATLEADSPSAPIDIKHGGEFFHGMLVYNAAKRIKFPQMKKNSGPSQAILDALNQTTPSKIEQETNLEDTVIYKRVDIVHRLPKDDFMSIAITDFSISMKLANLYLAEDILYVRLMVINKSSENYIIDFPEFIYEDPQESGSLKGTTSKKNVMLMGSNGVITIGSGDTSYLVYAIPKFVTSKKGWLRIILREKVGSRILSIEVPHKVLSKTKTF